ncbi:hypothetical protein KY290_037762 [Solanum tuberosum]|uniref:DUF4283 domain-containing protein n=1 Tax=Solanum tuberosum TaxID=4113 RepID=A0ABQ7TWH6_SOLTU|nr:hypothetical protein KY290_037762 [Solanum tuberosum]
MDEEMHLQQEILSHKDASTQGEIKNGELTKDRIKAKSDKNVSFKEMFITPYSNTIDQQKTPRTNLEEEMIIDEPPGSKKTNTDGTTNTYEGMEDEEGIHLTEEEKQRIYKPWSYSIIIKGPWFINGFFLSVKRWHPNFVASEAKETKSAIWIRLPELPTEFYDHSILARIGKKLGKLVKTDVCTLEAATPKYVLKFQLEFLSKNPSVLATTTNN